MDNSDAPLGRNEWQTFSESAKEQTLDDFDEHNYDDDRDNDNGNRERFPPFDPGPPCYIDPSRCAAPYPRTGTAEGSHRGDC